MVLKKYGLAFAIGVSMLASVHGICSLGCDATGGECVDTTCYCNAGYFGVNCSTTCTDVCTAPQVCTSATQCGSCDPACYSEGGSCAAVDTTPTCKCNGPEFSGEDCRTITCGAPDAPCENGGTCDIDVCTCPETHAGLVCELECTGCTGTQKCVEEGGSPVCKTKCADNDECLNSGTCTDELCDCATGWEGDLCDQEVLVCEPACTAAQKCVEEDGNNVCKTTCPNNDACKNNGTCENELCNCAEGWTGDLCTDSGVSSVVPSVLSMALFMLVIRL